MLAQDGKIRSALNQAQRTSARRPLSADRGAGETLPVSTRRCPRSGRRWRRWCRPSPAGFTHTTGWPGTASGRASCSGPNLQQVPHDPRFRALFVPEPGNVFVIADYSSMEMRAAAHVSGDIAMREAFENGLDLHRVTAARMTGKALADVTLEERKGAKAVNFGSIYGQGAAALVGSAWSNFDTVLDLAEARAWLDAFAASYPQLRWRREHYGQCVERRHISSERTWAYGIGRI